VLKSMRTCVRAFGLTPAHAYPHTEDAGKDAPCTHINYGGAAGGNGNDEHVQWNSGPLRATGAITSCERLIRRFSTNVPQSSLAQERRPLAHIQADLQHGRQEQ